MSAITEFDRQTLRFRSNPVDEALFLLRPVLPYGHVGGQLPGLPQTLAGLVGQPCSITVATLRTYLQGAGITQATIGGPLTGAVSATSSGATAGTKAKYFVIHDTSTLINGAAFPATINSSWSGNNLAPHMGANAHAHLFINRRGESDTGHDYSVPWRATKFEGGTHGFGLLVKGLFLHNELIQPRRRDSHGIDAISPDPGFPDAQYDRLALCYVTASVRRGKWMIPAYHCVLDEGLPDGHDDPQKFDLARWDARLGTLIHQINQGFAPAPQPAPATAAAAAAPNHHDDDWEPAPNSTPVSQVPYSTPAGVAGHHNDSARTTGLNGTKTTYSDGSVIIAAQETLTARRSGAVLGPRTGSCHIVIKDTARRIEQTNYSHMGRNLPHSFAFTGQTGLPANPPPGYVIRTPDNKRATQFGKNDQLDGGTGTETYLVVQTCSEVWGASVRATRMAAALGANWRQDPRRLQTMVEIYFLNKRVIVPLVDVGPGAATAHVDLTWAVDQFLGTQGGSIVDFRLLIPA